MIHRWGWTLILNPDGTTTAWNKDKTKVLHSHGPPVVDAADRIIHVLHSSPRRPTTLIQIIAIFFD